MEIDLGDIEINVPEEIGEPLLVMPYGSHLYGTATADSDRDYKVIVLQPSRSLYFRESLTENKICIRNGTDLVNSNLRKQPGDIEVEFIAVQTFLYDIVLGQTYALELVSFIRSDMIRAGELSLNLPHKTSLMHTSLRLFTDWTLSSTVMSMAGFAKKQTYDYVHRADLYSVYSQLAKLARDCVRSDTRVKVRKFVEENREVLEKIGKSCYIDDEAQVLFLYTAEFSFAANMVSMLDHIQSKLNKIGERVKETAEQGIDWKSIAHAIRIYWQCLDMMDKGFFQFPLKEVHRLFLIDVRAGKWDAEIIRTLLSTLEEEVLCAREAVLKKEQEQGKNLEDNLAQAKRIITDYLNSLYGVSK